MCLVSTKFIILFSPSYKLFGGVLIINIGLYTPVFGLRHVLVSRHTRMRSALNLRQREPDGSLFVPISLFLNVLYTISNFF